MSRKNRSKKPVTSIELPSSSSFDTPVSTLKATHEIALMVVVSFLFLLISISSARQKNSTFDEGTHIPAAYTYTALGDYRMNPEHPPLIKLLAGLPLRFLHPKMDINDAKWKEGNQWEFGLKFLYEWNDADRLIFWARMPLIFLTLLLGLVVWHCGRALYGPYAGIFALVLCLFNPDVIAHGQLVTTDLGVSCFIFLAVYTFYRALISLTIGSGLLVALAVGLSLVAKFSGILVFPMLALVGALFAYSETPIKMKLPKLSHRIIRSRQGKVIATLVLLAITGLLSLFVVWACYGFRYQYSLDPALSAAINWEHYWQKETLESSFIKIFHSLYIVPEGYSYGFLSTLESVEKRFSFLMGDYSTKGWWYYFIITFLIKTPLPFLILITMGAYFSKRYGAGMASEGMLLLPVALYWLITLANDINIGHRHLLPIYPFLFVYASKSFRAFDLKRRRVLSLVLGIMLGWYVVGTLLVYPNFLTYFNEITGVPSKGYLWLTDSNIDWGQDLKGLAKYRREHSEEPFYLSYFGTAPPEYYGIKAQFLPGFNSQMAEKMKHHLVRRFDSVPSGATVAISVTNLSGVYVRNYGLPGTDQFLQRLRELEPIAKIGNTIFVYHIP